MSLTVQKIVYIISLIFFIFTLVAFISFILGFFWIDVTKYIITSEKIPIAFNGYKILQLSDLHNSSYGKNNNRLLKKIEKENPDIIVMTGDMISSNSKNYNNFYKLAENIANKYPTYYIMGNHEIRLSWKKQIEIESKLSSLGVNILSNRENMLQKDDQIIRLYGLNQPITTYKNNLKNSVPEKFTLSKMEQIFPIIDNEEFNILLTHSPFDFEVFANWGADLVLSGHVHGGLIRLFGHGLLSPERGLFPKYSGGKYSLGSSKLIVSRGLGNGTLNLRIFNNPEICVIELKSEKV